MVQGGCGEDGDQIDRPGLLHSQGHKDRGSQAEADCPQGVCLLSIGEQEDQPVDERGNRDLK